MLDEPTVGVDPQSRNAILESVEHLSAAGMAVLYTTHYMEEAERLCDRVGDHRRGRDPGRGHPRRVGAPGGGAGQGAPHRLRAAGPARLQALRAVPGVVEATAGEESLELLVTGADRALAAILAAAAGAGISVHSVAVDEPNLEAVFLHLTGKALRD